MELLALLLRGRPLLEPQAAHKVERLVLQALQEIILEQRVEPEPAPGLKEALDRKIPSLSHLLLTKLHHHK